ncbi:MAG: leucine-rich repeat domain-containing protein [Ruminococcus sp.]|nr:leucine-rich repeat domain-containing protein [Ruminococcus sp.]
MRKAKKLIAALAAAVLMTTAAEALPRELRSGIGSGISVSAADISINASSVKLYAMQDGYDEYLSIPSSCKQKFQLKVTGAKNVTYSVENSDIVTVSSTGLIKPDPEVWYWYGSMGYSRKIDGREPDSVTTDYTFGKTKITVNADGKKFTVNVELADYAVEYANKKIDEYISKNVKSSMTPKQKIEQACKMAASYDYSPYCSGGVGMVITGGGDCWASTNLIISFCTKLGFKAWGRNANRDFGAGSGHMNAMIYAGGKYYEADAGYGGTAPRYYYIRERTSLFSYNYVEGGIEVYQYDGPVPANFTIPAAIDGQKVVSVGKDFLNSSETVKKITISEGITSIADGAFESNSELTEIVIPSSVKTIGDYVFAQDCKLTKFTVASGNKYFSSENGVLYDKNKTTIIYCPGASSVTVPSTVKSVADYAFYYNSNIKSVTLPSSVRTIGEGAFGDCTKLEKVDLGGVTKLGNYVFFECYSLKTMKIPSTVTTFGDYCVGFTYFDSVDTDFVIFGTKGSAAEKYANKNKIKFSSGKNLCDCSITIPYCSYTFTGDPIKPPVTVKDGTTKLTQGKDYKVTYDKETEVGVRTITVEGIGNYAGKYYKEFVIKPEKNSITGVKLASGGNVTLDWNMDLLATGYEVVWSKKEDFSDSKSQVFAPYADGEYISGGTIKNVFKTGETLYIKVRSFFTKDGKLTSTKYGNYSSVVSLKNTSDLSSFKATVPYASYTLGRNTKPTVTVKNGTVKLVEGRDFTVTYKNTNRIGTATAVITGKGFYKGTINKTYLVKPAPPMIIEGRVFRNGSFKLTWHKGEPGTTGYQVLYSTDPDFKNNVHSWTTTDLDHTSETFSKVPKAGETWYIKIRAFMTKDGKAASTRYGNYSYVYISSPELIDHNGGIFVWGF